MRSAPEVPRRLIQVLADPGHFIARLHDLGPDGDESESIVSWQARALIETGMVQKETE